MGGGRERNGRSGGANPSRRDGGTLLSPAGREEETPVSLARPGRLIDVLEACMAARLTPRRSGWSAATHLALDLERHFGVRAPLPAIESALRILTRRGRVRVWADGGGRRWYRLLDAD